MLRSRRFMRSDHPALGECEFHSRTTNLCSLASSARARSQSGLAGPSAAASSSSAGADNLPMNALGRISGPLTVDVAVISFSLGAHSVELRGCRSHLSVTTLTKQTRRGQAVRACRVNHCRAVRAKTLSMMNARNPLVQDDKANDFSRGLLESVDRKRWRSDGNPKSWR